MEEKVKALQEVPTPMNGTELKSFLGMLSYYSKFFNRIGTLTQIAKAISALAMKYRIARTSSHVATTFSLF